MPHIQISLVEGRDPEKIRHLITAVTDAVVTAGDAPPETVTVVVTEFPATHWAGGDRTIAEKRALG